MSVALPDDPRVDDLLSAWSRRRRKGPAPAPSELTDDPARLAALGEAIEDILRVEAALGLGMPEPEPDALGVEGHYEIAGPPLGRGGMGVVYPARDLKLGCAVAYKVIGRAIAHHPGRREKWRRAGPRTPALRNVGVVPVHGIALDGDGRDAYAMRQVEGGITLDRAVAALHADGVPRPARSAWRPILDRFVRICRTIEYAHGRRVLHRDLSPCNVLIAGDETFVIDWGLATAWAGPPGARDGEAAREARVAPTRAGTVQYTAPEVWDRSTDRPLGRTADVYSLGALLYLILTGGPPYAGRTQLEVLNLLRKGVRPTAVRPACPAVPRPLAAICDQAMAPAPDGRYETAGALADEVRRWLDGERVLADDEPPAETAVRWAVRHRTPVGVAAAVVAAAAIGFPVAYLRETGLRTRAVAASERADRLRGQAEVASARADRERRVALAERERAIRALDALIAQAETISALQASLPASKAVLDRSVRLLEDYAREAAADPGRRAAVASSYLRAGRIRVKLNQLAEAEGLLSRAADLAEVLARDAPRDAEALHLWAAALRDCGMARARLGRPAQAAPQWRKALAILGPITGPGSDPAFRLTLAKTLMALGNLAVMVGRAGEAQDSFGRGIDLASALAAEAPAEPAHRIALADLLNNRGKFLMDDAVNLGVVRDREKLLESRACHLKALDLRRRVRLDDPGNPDHAAYLAASYNHLGNTFQHDGPDRLGDAEAAYREALALLEPLAVAFPGDPDHRREIAQIFNNVAELMERYGRWDQVEILGAKVVETFAQIVKMYPNIPEHRAELAIALEKLAVAHRRRGATAEADDGDYEAAVQSARSASLQAAPALADAPATRALGLLRRLRDGGYFDDPRRLEALRGEPAFLPLRTRDDARGIF